MDVTFLTDEYGPVIKSGGMELRGDFSHMIPRLRSSALRGELLVKASGVSNLIGDSRFLSDEDGDKRPLLIDATAGLGEDSLILAAAGFRVKLFEKDPVIGALLEDAIEKARGYGNDLEPVRIAASRMDFLREDSIPGMKRFPNPDVVLLDPMFPEKKKKSLAKKKMQLLQHYEKPCEDEEALLEAALSLRPGRIIIKRPPKGPFLAGYKPTYSLTGKILRIDCIIP